ncbi:hypothetical protein FISHEDRAFT_62555 [Fistulina hepatica ATCC 64428]|nr:hypothetical protein FISHEDRAFT_62555 [Fistulina hepatica ATCC 64428]
MSDNVHDPSGHANTNDVPMGSPVAPDDVARDNDDNDSIPSLQSVSNSSVSDDDLGDPMDIQVDDGDSNWSDDDAFHDAQDGDMPPLEPIVPVVVAGQSRRRDHSDEDDERDRRHPSQRTGAAIWSRETSTPIFNGPFADPSLSDAQPQVPPPQPRAAPHAGRDTPTNTWADFMTRLGQLGGASFGQFEKDDPEIAKKLVGALEDVPTGLVRRLERVTHQEDGGGLGNGCAICLDRLLDAEGEGFGKTPKAPTEGGVESAVTTDSAPLTGRIVVLPCTHVFHASCLIPWFSRPGQTTCPTCRFNMDPHHLLWGRPQSHSWGMGGIPLVFGGPPDNAFPTEGTFRRTFRYVPRPDGRMHWEVVPEAENRSASDRPPEQAGTNDAQPPSTTTTNNITPPSEGAAAAPGNEIPGEIPGGQAMTAAVGAFLNGLLTMSLPNHNGAQTQPQADPPTHPTAAAVNANSAPPSVPAPTDDAPFNPEFPDPPLEDTGATIRNPPAGGGAALEADQLPQDGMFLSWGFDVFLGPPIDGEGERDAEMNGVQQPHDVTDTSANNDAHHAPPTEPLHEGFGFGFDVIGSPIALPPGFHFHPTDDGQGMALVTPTGEPTGMVFPNQPGMDLGEVPPQPPVPVASEHRPDQQASAPNSSATSSSNSTTPPGPTPAENVPPHPPQDTPAMDDLLRLFATQMQPPAGSGQRLGGLGLGLSQLLRGVAAARLSNPSATGPRSMASQTTAALPQQSTTQPSVALPTGEQPTPTGPAPQAAAAGGSNPPRNARPRTRPGVPFNTIPLFTDGLPAYTTTPEPPPRREWTLPHASGPSLRQVIEKKEREAGFRCHEPSCGVAPVDEDPLVEISPEGRRKFSIHPLGKPDEAMCVHRFHAPCLVTAQRIALRGADETMTVDGQIEVACPVCRVDGYISKEVWDADSSAMSWRHVMTLDHETEISNQLYLYLDFIGLNDLSNESAAKVHLASLQTPALAVEVCSKCRVYKSGSDDSPAGNGSTRSCDGQRSTGMSIVPLLGNGTLSARNMCVLWATASKNLLAYENHNQLKRLKKTNLGSMVAGIVGEWFLSANLTLTSRERSVDAPY